MSKHEPQNVTNLKTGSGDTGSSQMFGILKKIKRRKKIMFLPLHLWSSEVQRKIRRFTGRVKDGRRKPWNRKNGILANFRCVFYCRKLVESKKWEKIVDFNVGISATHQVTEL